MVGSICSVIVVFIVAKAIGLDTAVMNSMLPQAATTAIALPISESIGGIPAITSFAVIFNAVIVYALGALFLKTFRVKHPIAKGLALGTAGHALGVAVGIEMGEVEGNGKYCCNGSWGCNSSCHPNVHTIHWIVKLT